MLILNEFARTATKNEYFYDFIQLGLFYAGLFVFFVFACSQPYNSKKANLSEILVLLDLVIVSALALDRDSSALKRVTPYALTLLLIPFITTFIYFTFKIINYIW